MPAAPALLLFPGHNYISLATFRRNGQEILTPVWFAEQACKIYVMTRSDSGKYKRIRNNPRVRMAPCTARGRVTGTWCNARARILSSQEEVIARQATGPQVLPYAISLVVEQEKHLPGDHSRRLEQNQSWCR